MKSKEIKITPKYALGGALSGGLSGLQAGAKLGPWGMLGGALLGGVAGHFIEEDTQAKAEQEKASMASLNNSGFTNMNPGGVSGVITFEDGGLSVTNPLINVEEGELMVDRASGEIIEEYSKDRGFKRHSKTESPNNFVQARENGVVIPRRMAAEYKMNKNLRYGFLRDVLNKQADRMMYGVDADGNHVEFSKIQQDAKRMSQGGFAKRYGNGGGEPTLAELKAYRAAAVKAGRVDTVGNRETFFNNISDEDFREKVRFYADMKPAAREAAAQDLYREILKQEGRTSLEPLKFARDQVGNTLKDWTNQIFATSFEDGGTVPEEPVIQIDPDETMLPAAWEFQRQWGEGLTPMGLEGIPNTLSTVDPIASGQAELPGNLLTQDSFVDGVGKFTRPDNPLWTTGNTIGAIGTGISALGPLFTTMYSGIDRDEQNTYKGVSRRAEGEVADVFKGVQEEGLRDINMGANVATEMNRIRTTDFSSMLANQQNINRQKNRSVSSFLNDVASSRAKLMADLMFKGDMAEAQAEEKRLTNLDMNRDNYFSNISSNLSNLGVNMQGFGRNLNMHTRNQTQLNILKQMSPDFDIDAQGNITFKGKPLGVDVNGKRV